MKNILLTLLFLSSLAFSQTWDGSADTDWYTSNTEASSYTITTAEQLAGLAELVNSGTDDFSGKTVVLGGNITLSGTEWSPIGTYDDWDNIKQVDIADPFRGTFDGYGYVISGVYIDNDSDYQGLFGYISGGGTIKNLGVEDSYIKGNDKVGGLIGFNNGAIINSYSDAKVIGNDRVGGLTGGIDEGSITNSFATGEVSGSSYIGGLIGYNGEWGPGIITSSYAKGNVSGSSYVGGLAGRNNSTIINNYATGNVDGDYYVGGLVGFNTSIITNSFYDQTISGQNDNGIGKGKTTEYMQSESFVNDLNVVAAILSLNAWEYSADNYPILTNEIAELNISDYFDGEGTEENPYIITTKEQLEYISMIVNDGYSFSGEFLKLGNDIDLEGSTSSQWTPIGTYDRWDGDSGIEISNPFRGTFDGDGYAISGVYIDNNNNYQGLFGYINGGTIKNLGVEGSYIKGGNSVGGLLGYSNGTIINSYSKAKVSGNQKIGGLVGVVDNGSITESYATGDISGTGRYFGGLVGFSGEYGISTITNSYATGNVSNSANGYIGGLVGQNGSTNNGAGGTITNSYATGNLSEHPGNMPSYVGGLVGCSYGEITDSYATGDVKGEYYVGGLIGYSNEKITNSHATGAVYHSSYSYSGGYVGGLIGYSNDDITNSYATGAVSGEGNRVGGLVGGSGNGTITNSYATGDVEGGNYTGGLVGGSSNGTITNSYATGDVKGGNYTGGLVGQNYGSIANCYATGNLKGGQYAGGLVGQNYGSIANSYATGNLEGSQYVGGLVGHQSGSGTLINCYAIGEASSFHNDYDYAQVGGLVGYQYGTTITNGFYKLPTDIRTENGIGESKTAAYMQSQDFVNNLNVFAAIYSMNAWEYSAGKYPTLTNEPAVLDLAVSFAGGDGTKETPYIITTKDHLVLFSTLVNSGNSFDGEYLKLGNNIDIEGSINSQWTPIGTYISWDNVKQIDIADPFRGTFDGDGHFISGIHIDNQRNFQGLFGYINGSTIKNLGVVGSYVKGGNFVGGLVGSSNGTIINCYSEAEVRGNSRVGSLVGSVGNGSITNSYATGDVSHTYVSPDDNGRYFGGLVGINGDYDGSGTITNSYSTGSVYVAYGTAIANFGGLVGQNGVNSTITNSYYNSETSISGMGEGKITEEMQTQSTYEGWDFENIWDINSEKNNGYPFLRANALVIIPDPIDPDPIDPTPVDECEENPESCEEETPIVIPELVEECEEESGSCEGEDEDDTPIILSQIAKGQIGVKAVSEGILLSNLPSNAKIELYNLQGKQVYSAMPVEAQCLVPLQTKGVYIVKAGAQKFSVVVK